jgi:hypothetical protein
LWRTALICFSKYDDFHYKIILETPGKDISKVDIWRKIVDDIKIDF